MAETQKHGLTIPTEHFLGDFTEFLTSVKGPCKDAQKIKCLRVRLGNQTYIKSKHRKSIKPADFFCCHLEDVQLLPKSKGATL